MLAYILEVTVEVIANVFEEFYIFVVIKKSSNETLII